MTVWHFSPCSSRWSCWLGQQVKQLWVATVRGATTALSGSEFAVDPGDLGVGREWRRFRLSGLWSVQWK